MANRPTACCCGISKTLRCFIEQITDAAEKERAGRRYHTIREFAEAKTCRHCLICLHFGETPKWTSCAACDACGFVPAWFASLRSMRTSTKRRRSRTRAVEIRTARVNGGATTTVPQPAPNAELREYLRQWRREIAKADTFLPSLLCMTRRSRKFAGNDRRALKSS
jgi:RecQ zinc-binding